MGGNNFWWMANFLDGYRSRFRSRRAIYKAMIYTRSHSFLPALKKWMQWPWITGLLSVWWRWLRSRWERYPLKTVYGIIKWYSGYFKFGIVVNIVLMIEKCSLKCKCLTWYLIPVRFSSEYSLGIKVHVFDPNKPHLLAVALMNN